MPDYAGGGFIMIQRIYQNTRSYSDPDANHVYIHCQMKANISPVTVHGVRLERGQFLTSMERFATECGMDESKMRRILRKLESDGLIIRENAGKVTEKPTKKVTDKVTEKATKNGTVITVVNYGVSGVEQEKSDGETDEESDGESDGQSDDSIINKNKEQRKKKEIEYKDTRNINPDGLTPPTSIPSDAIQKQIDEIIGYMDEQGFNYDDCQGTGGIRGLLGKYLRKEGRDPGEIIKAVKLTVERDAAIYDDDHDVGYFIRCLH